MNTQFVILPTTVWLTPLESLAGKNITWAFLGFSSWFQTLLGLLEFVPAFFLLFRRTAFVGAIFLLPLTLSVTLINFALQLWPQTQIISALFLSLNLIVLSIDYHKVIGIVKLAFPVSVKPKLQSIEIALGLIVTALLVFFSYTQLSEYKNDSNQLTGDWFNKKPTEWMMVYRISKDSVIIGEEYKLYFMPFGTLEEQRSTENSFNEKYYEYDETKQSLAFKWMENDSLISLYQVQLTADTLKLKVDDMNSLVFVKREINSKH
ncbi:MAG: hypothetical protein ACK44D_09290 [Bacteroidia bacterium]